MLPNLVIEKKQRFPDADENTFSKCPTETNNSACYFCLYNREGVTFKGWERTVLEPFCLKLIFITSFQLRKKRKWGWEWVLIWICHQMILDLVQKVWANCLMSLQFIFFFSKTEQMSLNQAISKLPSNSKIIWIFFFFASHIAKIICTK